ncbi:type II secretion system protein [Photobacterium sanguinicancri]|uniref:Prepilin-type cleavage/methylation domain-containing protein n=1 Tax=Photobacterium sanguinicancri TaxID=875932 RepID=A0ABX4FTZ8_9GAMM|nr:type II secretion system protein [Photobacterium sanguinicancri]OZS42356.1 prepilin-type cleavage/methylation domain-containing protein [Photobacterium sanguinicancri]
MRNKGFTLIELVVVIVILGILAVTAAPRFLNVQRDARIAALNGFKGAFYAADGIVMSKAMTAGIENSMYDTEIPNTGIYVRQGVMSLNAKNIAAAMNTDGFTILDKGSADMPSIYVLLDNMVENGQMKQKCLLIFTRGVTTVSDPKPLLPLKAFLVDDEC